MQIKLDPQETQEFLNRTAYWDGFVAGANAAADAVRLIEAKRIADARTPPSPPAQQE